MTILVQHTSRVLQHTPGFSNTRFWQRTLTGSLQLLLLSSLNSWLRLVVGSAKPCFFTNRGHIHSNWTILNMCEALCPPHILGASRAASASPGGVYEKTRFRKNRKFQSQLFKLENMFLPFWLHAGTANILS